MSKIIVIHNHKGGVGKTTSTMCLATTLAGMTRSVAVWDADPQGSATEWAEYAAEAGDPLPFDVEIVNQVSLKRAPRNGTADYIIIDTPPGDPKIADMAVRLADFVILPTSPSVIDLTRMLETADQIPSRVPRAALITRANKQTIAYKAATEFLHGHPEVPVFSHAIGDRQAIQNSYGTRPEIFYDYSAVTDELVEVLEAPNE